MNKKFALVFSIVLFVLGFITINAAAAVVSEGTIDSISWVLTDDGHLKITGEGALEKTVAEALGSDGSIVTKITVGEGITSIEKYAFDSAYVSKNVKEIYTPSTVKSVGSSIISTAANVTVYCYQYSAVGDWCEKYAYNYEFVGVSPLWQVDEGTYGENITWHVDNHRNLVIDGEGEIPSGSNPPWYSYLKNVQTIELGKGITLIGKNALPKIYSTGGSGNYYKTLGELTTIYGYTNSIAEKMANILGVEFVSRGVIEERTIILSGQLTDTITYSVDNYGKLEISGTGETPDYTLSDSAPWGQFNYSPVTEIQVSDGITYLGDFLLRTTAAKKITIGNSVTTIGAGCFCYSIITEITLPASVRKLGRSAFSECRNLKSVTLPEGLFVIQKWTFLNCTALEEISIPSSMVLIKTEAFKGCKSIAKIYGYENNVGKRLAEKMETEFISLGEGKYIYSVTGDIAEGFSWSLDSRGVLTVYGEGSFGGWYTAANCQNNAPWYSEYEINVTEIFIGEGITSIGSYFFAHTGAQSVVIPDTVTSIDVGAFAENKNLKWVWLSENMTAIPKNAFINSAVEYVYIPKSVKTIGAGAFSGTALSDVYYGGNSAYWTTSVEGKEYIPSTASIHYDATMNGVASALKVKDTIFVDVKASLSDNVKAYVAVYKDGIMTKLVPVTESKTYKFDAECDTVKVFFWTFNKGYAPKQDVYVKTF
ncbi:MAG: leucine-rich repeat domain-containing protein [Clostridia bacterium]|nr:leucine-rich repeat domain-containing protein [Clostridia bacterium]